MVGSHKGLSNAKLSAPDPNIDDSRAQEIAAFYEEMSTAFITERDMASGASSGQRSAGR